MECVHECVRDGQNEGYDALMSSMECYFKTCDCSVIPIEIPEIEITPVGPEIKITPVTPD
jgi:hypothetical protein